MVPFGLFYLDKEKDIQVELFLEKEEISYVLRTPNHGTGNLITNLALLCRLPLDTDPDGLKVIRGKLPCYIDGQNRVLYVFRLLDTKIANIYPDGRIERKASIPAIAKTLMSQTKDYRLSFRQTVVKTYIFRECKFRTDLHTHMNANLDPDLLIALGIHHQIRYPLYYIRKLGLRCSPAQEQLLARRRSAVAETFRDSPLKGKYLDRKINDSVFLNFASLILENPENASWNLPRIRASLAVMKDGQAVFTNLEKVYLYRYVFCKGVPSEDPIVLSGAESIPDEDIVTALRRMAEDRKHPVFGSNTLLEDKLLWIARSYAARGIDYAEISDTALVRPEAAPELLAQAHRVLPAVRAETGVTLRFLAALRRTPLTILKDKIDPENTVRENLRTLRAVSGDPYVAGSDIVGEEMNDIRDLAPLLRELARIAEEDPSFTVRVHAGENDSLPDNVANAVRCVREGLRPGQPMPRMRIGHGLYTTSLSSAKGRELLRVLRESGTVLEIQITSNVRLNNLSSLRAHPLRQYLAAGVSCVQGTDGGALYGTDSIDEQLALEKMLNLTHEELLA
ncbi:MAG: adenosine deaminase, partial [Clostridia bacterium]|nr:adenosine deaminase [Clostridia bacterium]